MNEALAELLPHLRMIAMGFCNLCAAAGMEPEDLAHETLIKAAARESKLPMRESDRRRYLHRIMANLIKDRAEAAQAAKRGGGRVCSLDEMLDSMSRATVRLETILPAPGPGPRTQAQRRQVRERIAAAIDSLPIDQRAAVILHLVHEFTLAETAEAMKRTEASVRGLVERGRAALREQLEDVWNER